MDYYKFRIRKNDYKVGTILIIMETERLELREFNDDDISVLYTIFSDAETMKYYPSPFNFFQQKYPTSMVVDECGFMSPFLGCPYIS